MVDDILYLENKRGLNNMKQNEEHYFFLLYEIQRAVCFIFNEGRMKYLHINNCTINDCLVELNYYINNCDKIFIFRDISKEARDIIIEKLQEYNFPYKEGIYKHDKEKNIFIQLTNRFKYT